MRKRVTIALTALLGAVSLAPPCLRPGPEVALRSFHDSAHERKEDGLLTALIAAGDPVVPHVVEAIGHAENELRGYMIVFLAAGGHDRGIPTLKALAADESEELSLRATAVRGLYHFEPATAKILAQELTVDQSLAGRTIEEVLAGRVEHWERPTVWEVYRAQIAFLLGG